MKRILVVLFALVLMSAAALAQNYRDVVYLKNGSVIKGTVLEQVTGGNIKIQTADGSIFVYPSSEVVKVVKEEVSGGSNSASRNKNNAAAPVESVEQFRGWRYSPGLGIGVALVKGGSASGIVEFGLGKDTSDQVYLGGGIQFIFPFIKDPNVSLGAFFENRIYFPSYSKISFQIRDRIYFAIEPAHENFFLGLTIMPGVMMKLSPSLDLLLNAGYQLSIMPSYSAAGHSLVFQTAFDFHRAQGAPAKKRDYHPSGVEIGFGGGLGIISHPEYKEDGADASTGICFLSLGYRFNPHFSAALELAPMERKFFAKPNQYYETLYADAAPLALVGRYRLLDKTFSPVGTVSIGLASPHSWTQSGARKNVLAVLLSPKVGVSWRLGSGNGHLELCGGVGTGFSAPFKLRDNDKAMVYSMFAPEFSLRYYHTLKWGSALAEKMGFEN